MGNPRKTIRIPLPGGGTDVDISDYLGIIDTDVFQRLSRIKQLSTVNFSLPGGAYNRNEHSIGTLYQGRRIGRSVGLDEYGQRLLEACCILHDIGHGTYSHISENITEGMSQISHDDKTLEKIDRIEGQIGGIGVSPDDVRAVLSRENPMFKLILTILGADKIDYVIRDNLHCGFPSPDVERIIEYAGFDGEHYFVQDKAEGRITDFLKAWWTAHKEIYLRKSVELAEAVKMKMIYYAIRNGELEPEDLFEMDDNELDSLLLRSESEIVREINSRFLDRKIPKTVGSLRMEGYESTESLRNKPIHVEGLSQGEYEEFVEFFDNFETITELDRRFQEEFGLQPYQTAVTTSPQIDRMMPKDVTIMRKGSRKDEIMKTHVKDELMSIREEMRRHYAIRFAVDGEERYRVCEAIRRAGLKNFVFEN
jgi:HD superfamily phosphohydrolase